MEVVLVYAILGLAALLAVPTLVYAVECLAGSLPPRPLAIPDPTRPAVVVLVPAHNEEHGIVATIASIRAQMRDGDRLLVVADNCSDATARIARASGAECLERSDPVNRGKGYALDAGLRHIALAPHPVVVCVDADCTLVDGSLDRLATLAAATGRPVQSCNLMIAEGKRRIDHAVAEFAFKVKNLVRPRGLARLGFPCLLTGTGMALPWTLAKEVKLGHGHLVEDMKLGIDLAEAGYPPLYCESAGVRSLFPVTLAGATSQRSRWENGHLAMMAASLPSLVSPRTLGNRDRLVMTLDVLVPPLTLLAFAHVAAVAAGVLVLGYGLGTAPLLVSVVSAALFAASTGLAWAIHGREILPAGALCRVPAYMLAKAWIYPRAILGQFERSWVRTDRNEA